MLPGLHTYPSVFRTLAERCSAAAPLVGAGALVLSGAVGLWAYRSVYLPTEQFPVGTVVTVPAGATVRTVSEQLYHAYVVQSPFAFRAMVRLVGSRDSIQAGDYVFDRKLSLYEVVDRIVHGRFGVVPIRVTIPEGATTYQMAEILAGKFTTFDAAAFLLLAADREGYLYPDTYVFLPNATASQVLDAMERTFYERLRSLEDKIAAFGRPIHEVITMASLLEKEAYREDDRRQIAGVLWHRLAIEMPLQVDAVFGYMERSDTFSPKLSDLAQESPYNTYRNKGLPPGPINSPSLSAIEAAVTPIDTGALYYLHGRDGMLHLARTFREHVVNRRSYLE